MKPQTGPEMLGWNDIPRLDEDYILEEIDGDVDLREQPREVVEEYLRLATRIGDYVTWRSCMYLLDRGNEIQYWTREKEDARRHRDEQRRIDSMRFPI